MLSAFSQEGKIFSVCCSTGESLLDFLKFISTAILCVGPFIDSYHSSHTAYGVVPVVHPAATFLCRRKWSTVYVITFLIIIILWTAEKCVVCLCSCAQRCTFVIVECLHVIQSPGAVLMQCSFFHLPNAKELYHNYMQCQDSWDSTVGIVTVYGLGDWWIVAQLLAWERDFSLLKNMYTSTRSTTS
jgi:hypothetical protein